MSVALPKDTQARLLASAQAASGGRRCCCCSASGWCAYAFSAMELLEAFEARVGDDAGAQVGELAREWHVVRRAWHLPAWRRRLLAAGIGPAAFTVPAWRKLLEAAINGTAWCAVERGAALCPGCFAAALFVHVHEAGSRSAWGADLAEEWFGRGGRLRALDLLRWAREQVEAGGERAVVRVMDQLVVFLGASLDRTVLMGAELRALDGVIRGEWARGLEFDAVPDDPSPPPPSPPPTDDAAVTAGK